MRACGAMFLTVANFFAKKFFYVVFVKKMKIKGSIFVDKGAEEGAS